MSSCPSVSLTPTKAPAHLLPFVQTPTALHSIACIQVQAPHHPTVLARGGARPTPFEPHCVVPGKSSSFGVISQGDPSALRLCVARLLVNFLVPQTILHGMMHHTQQMSKARSA